MNSIDKTQQITKYLADKSTMYHDWFQPFRVTDDEPNVKPYSSHMSLEQLRKMFEKWLDSQKDFLKGNICESWGQLKKKGKLPESETLLIACLADILGMLTFPLFINVLATAAILISERYVNKMCIEEGDEQS